MVTYVLERRGEKSCKDGSRISSSLECTEACNALQKNFGYLKNGKVCYVAGNGRTCKQDGRHGAKASLICKGNGTIHTCIKIIVQLTIFLDSPKCIFS